LAVAPAPIVALALAVGAGQACVAEDGRHLDDVAVVVPVGIATLLVTL
jgi:hypothetical protein